MEIKYTYNIIKKIITDNLDDLSLFEVELEKLDVNMDLKATIILKIASELVKTDDRMTNFLNFGVGILETKNCMQCSDLLLCALACEKSCNFDRAIQYYTRCAGKLPNSGIKFAVEGMKHRAFYKKDNKPENIELCKDFFEKAYEHEKNPTLKRKWETALGEVNKYLNKEWE